ncbi:hypothetical protein F7R01_05595 [Pseudomonas argentinensis]|uniref:Uncharacterized protein n=1 Tax=Phytopseudomonas argentinensis TaxID=289370 RepID=A0A1I3KCB8_9GAMM|nr:hypothetical protein [Pseudomonas argentinensis]KAB0550688.1 hypothetical protein F7R01_05595 [Pseudomonas argentinensis]SFI69938.1 hypothetical protein SAMN05216602_2407 [Pseudomonas argentinensis]
MSAKPTNRQLADYLGLSEDEVGSYRLDSIQEGSHWRVAFTVEMPKSLRSKLPACLMVVVPGSIPSDSSLRHL